MISPNTYDEEEIPTLLRSIKKLLGLDLTLVVFGVTNTTYKKWIAGPHLIDSKTKKLILTINVICETLKALPQDEVKMWMVSFSEYIYGIPALSIKTRPADVLMAAQYVSTVGSEDDLR